MKELLVRLPWPPSSLSPNARGHWSVKARAAKKYRGDCRILCQAHGARALPVDALHVEVTFYPPDRRRRDSDNLMASCKACFDGVADATGVDDSRWQWSIKRGEPVKGGAVLVHLKPVTGEAA